MENNDNNLIIEEKESKKKGKKEKKGKKFLKKQKKEEEERKRKEEEKLKLQNEESEENSNNNEEIDKKENLKEDIKNNDLKEDDKKENLKEENKIENEKAKEEDNEEKAKEDDNKESEETKPGRGDIETSSKNIENDNDNNNNGKEDDKKEDEKEINDNENENNNNNIIDNNEEEENENEENKENDNKNISIMIKKLLKTKKGSVCQELAFKEGEIDYIIDKSYDILKKEDSMLKISAPLYICGDIHGQFYDLLRVFEILGFPPKSKFLFLGDYVDRGKQSLESLLLLLCLKIKYPSKIFLLRGNHESEALNKIYGFYDECKRRISVKIFKKITTLFNILPITALINENILCMHGGLSPDLKNIDQLNKILRPTDIPDEGLLCDLVWSDPSDELSENFGENERNISVTFSKNVIEEFNKNNELDLICRAHQVVEEGDQFFAGMKLVTIFTAPNYMGEFDNNGGILEVGDDLLCKIHVLRPMIDRIGKRKRITQLVN